MHLCRHQFPVWEAYGKHQWRFFPSPLDDDGRASAGLSGSPTPKKPRRSGARVLADFGLELIVTGHPAAAISVADTMLSSTSTWSHNRRYYRWRDHDRSVGITPAIKAAMETKAASARDLNDQTVMSLIASNRHGLSGN